MKIRTIWEHPLAKWHISSLIKGVKIKKPKLWKNREPIADENKESNLISTLYCKPIENHLWTTHDHCLLIVILLCGSFRRRRTAGNLNLPRTSVRKLLYQTPWPRMMLSPRLATLWYYLGEGQWFTPMDCDDGTTWREDVGGSRYSRGTRGRRRRASALSLTTTRPRKVCTKERIVQPRAYDHLGDLFSTSLDGCTVACGKTLRLSRPPYWCWSRMHCIIVQHATTRSMIVTKVDEVVST